MPKTIHILGIQINSITKKEFLAELERNIDNKKTTRNSLKLQTTNYTHKPIHIITVNPEMLVEAKTNKQFRQTLTNADYCLADGIGLLWASKFQTIKSKNRLLRLAWLVITGASLVFIPNFTKSEIPEQIQGRLLWIDICKLAGRIKRPVFLLGKSDGLSTLKEVKTKLSKKFQKLKVSGDFNWKNNPTANYYRDLEKQIPKNAVIFSSLGHPEQDMIFSKLKLNNSIQIGVGGSFDFFLNKQKTAQKLFTKTGTEWLYRLLQQPKRIKRIYKATIKFIWLVWKSK